MYEQIGNPLQLRISDDPHIRRLASILTIVGLALTAVVAVLYLVDLFQNGSDIRSWLRLAVAVLLASIAVWLLTQISRAKRVRR